MPLSTPSGRTPNQQAGVPVGYRPGAKKKPPPVAAPARTGAFQKICTECGDPFMAGADTALTCSIRCRKRRSDRMKRAKAQGIEAPEYATAAGASQLVLEQARNEALDDLPTVAREVLAEELRPAVREALTGKVLQSIGDMVGLMPLVQAALEDDLTALRPQFDSAGVMLMEADGETPYMAPDYDRRAKAVALVVKYTVGQPGLAPQPEAPELAPITIVFPPGMEPPAYLGAVDADAVPLQLEPGQRLCDMCQEPKDEHEFMAGSRRCTPCHEANRARIEAAIAERTAGTE